MLVMVVLVGVVVGLVRPRRGRFGAPRAVAVVFAAAGVQILSTATHGSVHAVLLTTSIALGVLWVALQRRHAASVLLATGAAMNVAVVAVNGGMPVDRRALASVGRRQEDVRVGFLYKHVPMDADTRLSWLADRLPVPIQRNVISIGDVIMAVAVCMWVADSISGWRETRRSAGAVHREHGRGSGCEVVGGCE